MASSGNDSRCALGTHPHTLPCLSVGVIAAEHCCQRDGDHDGVTPREGLALCWLWSGEAVCLGSTERSAQSFRCGHSVGITRCCGVRRSRSPDEDGLVVIWQPRTSGPSPFRIALAARLVQHRPGIVLLQECRHQSAPVTRLVGCSDFHQACSGRAGGVAFVVRHTLPCERLLLVAPTAWRAPPSACAHRPAPACTW
ncbi:hypothetical protein TcCL_ESM09144 [Trypanosoma cruzi]|nr:hypothetical protein TcCL_ESM09144 [Trypanosoma cruzi]